MLKSLLLAELLRCSNVETITADQSKLVHIRKTEVPKMKATKSAEEANMAQG